MNTAPKPSQDQLYRFYLKSADRHGYTVNQYYARIERGILWFEDNREMSIDDPDFLSEFEHLTTLEIISFERTMFVPRGLAGGSENMELDVKMSLRAERRGKFVHWYAYRKMNGVLRKLYVGHSDEVTTNCLYRLALRFQGYYTKP